MNAIRDARWAFIGILVALAPSVACAQSPAAVADLETFVRAEQARQGIPGIAIAVVSGDSVVWQKGFGVASVEGGTAAPLITPETLFQIGSLTKAFTATAILSASAAGTFNLERPVGKYIQELNPCIAAITTEQLLRHSGGLKDEPDENGPHDEGALLAYAQTWRADYCLLPPETAYSYSNSGFALAGLALQQALGKPYAECMKQLVFDPLGMSRATFQPTVAMSYPFSLGARKQTDKPAAVVRPVADDARLWPAGEIWTNAGEVARFMIALLNDGKLDGAQALPAGLFAQLSKARADVSAIEEKYGYGLALSEYRGLPRVGHGGTMPGFSVQLQMIPERRLGVIVLTNLETSQIDPFVAHALDAFLPAADTAKPQREVAGGKPARVALPPEPERYLGSYTNPRRWTLEIAKNDRQLLLKMFGRDFPLEMIDEDRFLLHFPGREKPELLIVGPRGKDGAAYMQFYVWAFARVKG
ncbi:MAG TPA: serine hydrolase domain-containing protein [Thermoanaerobaculia bacterium]|nr:serine hydrolase domain-containing protein [Thermoanaerobaculia bacterium]